MSSVLIPKWVDVLDAAARIAPYAHITPVLSSTTLDTMSGAQLYFKCENQQRVGAFKFRGACNAVFALSEADAKRGVVTHSSGNHGAALALAAQLRGIPAHIVVPKNAVSSKVDNIRRYGAQLIFCEPTQTARENTAADIAQQTGAQFIHPFNNFQVMAGQGTCAMELLHQAPDLDAVIAPIGGGGLAAGTCIAAHAIKSSVELFAAEPEGANDAFRSQQQNARVNDHHAQTICDGLTTLVGEPNFAMVQQHGMQVLCVSDDEVRSAQALVLRVLKEIVEPSCATVLAAVLRYPQQFRNKRVGLILTGGNIDSSTI